MKNRKAKTTKILKDYINSDDCATFFNPTTNHVEIWFTGSSYIVTLKHEDKGNIEVGEFKTESKAQKEAVTLPTSHMKAKIAEILKEEGYITNFKIVEEGKKSFIRIYLKYNREKKAVIKNLQKVSKPGLRRYVPSEKIPRVLNGLGLVILSTSQGVITGRKARELHVGGEVLCKVW